jgi:single-stranded-DNA-specific exonuclease
LYARGHVSAESAQVFLDARLTDLIEPSRLPGVDEAAERLLAAVKSNRRIVVYGDYDADGVAATSILWRCLQLAGANVHYHIPARLEDGYGLHCDALDQIHRDDAGTLVVTVDCGISAVKEADHARGLGLELIVTDHHQFAATLPAADTLVHPRLPGTDYPFGELCGAAVAFKLAWRLCQHLGDGRKAPAALREFLVAATGIAAIGTISDVMPLIDENRVLVRHGLMHLHRHAPLGLRELCRVAGLPEDRPLSAEEIAYQIGPRINAAGRLGQARLAVELLTTGSPERAAQLASYLEKENQVRQKIERDIGKEARELLASRGDWMQQPVLVLAKAGWHLGVVGIVAGRLAEEFRKPTVILSLNQQDGTAGGSARTFAGFDWHAALTGCQDLLLKFGGHQAAAGMKLAADRVDSMRVRLCEFATKSWTPSTAESQLNIDAEVRLQDLTLQAVTDLERLGPFGRGNPRPVLASSKVELVEPPRKMGAGEQHLSLRVRQQGKVMRGVAFGRGEWADDIAAAGNSVSLCYAPTINRFRGNESVEFQLIDWQPDGQS